MLFIFKQLHLRIFLNNIIMIIEYTRGDADKEIKGFDSQHIDGLNIKIL